MLVLVVNAGSSSLKLRLVDGHDAIRSADLPAGPGALDTSMLVEVLGGWPAPDVVGHRIVHGGAEFDGPVRVTPAVRRALEELVALAPLHQPNSLAALDAVAETLTHVVSVASFDTAFHRSIPAAASTYAVPLEWRDRYAVRRYGFHGISHQYCSRRAAELVDRPLSELRIVTCHLGAGASLAAVAGERSVDTTMGFTPLEGLVMATRSGSVDPGVILWLQQHQHYSLDDIAEALEHRSGLLALAGTSDMRDIERAVRANDTDAVLALDVFIHRLVSGIGSMAAAAGGLDVLAFTGGIGENSALVRERAATQLAWLGVHIDAERNGAVEGDRSIGVIDSSVRTVVVHAREDLQIAREALAVLSGEHTG